MESELIFTLVYCVVAVCFILAPKEFQTAGLTVQSLFASYLGSEDFDFVRYHIKRTTATVLVHSFIPIGKHFVSYYSNFYVVLILFCVMSCCVMLCYVMLCYVMLCYVMLCYIMSCCVMLCYVMLCYVMLCYVMLCYVILCYAVLCYVMLCCVMLCYVLLCYVMLC